MSNMQKKVFNIPTTCDSNAAPYQDSQVHNWLVAIMTEAARQHVTNLNNQQGENITIIVEVLS